MSHFYKKIGRHDYYKKCSNSPPLLLKHAPAPSITPPHVCVLNNCPSLRRCRKYSSTLSLTLISRRVWGYRSPSYTKSLQFANTLKSCGVMSGLRAAHERHWPTLPIHRFFKSKQARSCRLKWAGPCCCHHVQ